MLPFDDPHLFLQPSFRFALVEASNDAAAPGFRLYQLLKQSGFSVSPVNAVEHEIQGDTSFPSLAAVRPFPDVVVLVPPMRPEEGLEILRNMRDTGIFRLWAEPGVFTEEMKRFGEANNISFLTGFSLERELYKLPLHIN